MSFERIAVIGLGYIGLPTAVAFAQAGKSVIGVEINPQIVAQLNEGKSHIAEPKLAESLKQAVDFGRFFATNKIPPADAFIIAVPTPFQADFQPDLTAVKAVVEALAPVLKKGDLIVLESTSPVGTTERLAKWLHQARPDLRFPEEVNIAYCPERVLPGKIMTELFENDRIIGGLSPQCSQQAVKLYQLFVKGECLTTQARTAEMCKLTENSFRDVNIAFANELSLICDRLNIDVWELIALANRHPRVNILQPGAGVGGHCIAVDPWFIVAQAPEQARLIRMAREVNDHKPQWVIEKVKQAVADCVQTGRPLAEITIACLGITFKADVDDLRQSPALAIAEQLSRWHQGKLLIVEPHIPHLPLSLATKAQQVSLKQSIEQADILVLLVDHQCFKLTPKPERQNRWIIDTRGVWNK
ncbi:UDP-N-acetyl-D-mannosaminuronic acid dehydrogenase [Pasteurellaceae bacterium Macca]|nr:UDP-N-acetyl-D-mannosaminuronic acid dehydrogenase [Pasteurellaceae bacterium Macca]